MPEQVRIQESTVTRTPWEDVADEPPCLCVGEREEAPPEPNPDCPYHGEGTCRVCGGPLEGAPGPECDDTGCPDRDCASPREPTDA